LISTMVERTAVAGRTARRMVSESAPDRKHRASTLVRGTADTRSGTKTTRVIFVVVVIITVIKT